MLQKYSLEAVMIIKHKKQIIHCVYNIIPFIINATMFISTCYKANMSKSYDPKQKIGAHTHRYTLSETRTLAAFSLSEIGVELPVEISENQAASDSAGRPVCAIQASSMPCLVGQTRGPTLPKSLLSHLPDKLRDVVLDVSSRWRSSPYATFVSIEKHQFL